jgi:hypothetical protein
VRRLHVAELIERRRGLVAFDYEVKNTPSGETHVMLHVNNRTARRSCHFSQIPDAVSSMIDECWPLELVPME